mmetsp:Transcript_40572/g.102131  ORF Transcript_40572/g.102131 Transcript_40572/m.102131 type:complete len:285 (+) Transcript_40572:172-1026(+)|eukprot:CAMPEP_0177651168 /NCGR_PEP_ID=MMETSP0447-20121125/12379_1 /TAXON_ID=0 /ORGANISM="Stygamoeba regulata, Strain BSH-02190019" /LENGTH=284 /DNA_ID=CAMNT_0019154181 /DNA_START=3216 /DNA_END=4070 /DNA_ORIENTATION=-
MSENEDSIPPVHLDDKSESSDSSDDDYDTPLDLFEKLNNPGQPFQPGGKGPFLLTPLLEEIRDISYTVAKADTWAESARRAAKSTPTFLDTDYRKVSEVPARYARQFNKGQKAFDAYLRKNSTRLKTLERAVWNLLATCSVTAPSDPEQHAVHTQRAAVNALTLLRCALRSDQQQRQKIISNALRIPAPAVAPLEEHAAVDTSFEAHVKKEVKFRAATRRSQPYSQNQHNQRDHGKARGRGRGGRSGGQAQTSSQPSAETTSIGFQAPPQWTPAPNGRGRGRGQ